MNRKLVVLFVEGPTEIEFYKAIIKYAHDKMSSRFECDVQYLDMKGIGNYKSDAVRRLKFLCKQNKYKEHDVYAFLCIDTDVFELQKKPPINKADVKKKLIESGAKQVHYIDARKSIEDWFLDDFSGVISALRLPKNTRRPFGSGQDALKALFKSAHKVYVKGGETQGLVSNLDIGKIIGLHCHELKPLCRTMGFDCTKVCRHTLDC